MKVLKFNEFINENTTDLGKIYLTFVGDIKHNNKISEDDKFFEEVKFIFESSDCVVGNLETGFYGDFANEDLSLSADDKLVDKLKEVGLTHLSIANNHILDCGISGYQRNKSFLKENEIGTLENRSDIKIGNYNISIHSFTYGVNNSVNEDIEKFLTESDVVANTKADLNIAYVHWESKNTREQEKVIEGLINRGFGAVLGSGNHMLGEVNLKENVLTATSLGDFLNSEKSEGGILKVILTEGMITDVILYEVNIDENSKVIYKQRKIIK